MIWSRTLITIVLFSALLLPVVGLGQDSFRDVRPVITRYFDLISSGNYDIASDMWMPKAIERSSRFGITYTDIVLKADCNSPIIRNLDELGSKLGAPVRGYEALDDEVWYQLEYSSVLGSALLSHYYYMERRGDWFWLGYAQDFYSAEWPIVESKYFRIRTDAGVEKYLGAATLAEADQFVETMASQLGISDDMLTRVADEKIEYFYCSSDSVVEQLTGFLVKGTLDLASNDIITADFPHFHELTHLLVNIRLGEMPLYTLPLMREGMAVNLAGRWGKHPAALMDLALFLYREELVIFDSILTMDGFGHETGADIAYPVAGLFSGFLIDRLGMEQFLQVYLRTSGEFDYVNDLSVKQIQEIFVGAIGVNDWTELKTDFDKYLDDWSENEMVAMPGAGDNGKKLIDEDRVVVRDVGDWIAFEFSGESAERPPEGNFIFGKKNDQTGHVSALFESQYGVTQPFEGYRFGVRFDKNEIGLYDYTTNLLVAKYIWGITPSDDYYDDDKNKIGVRFRKSMFRDLFPAQGDWHFLPL